MANRTCSVPRCERDVKSKGWCNAHYVRWFRTGDTGPAEIGPAAHRKGGRQAEWRKEPATRCAIPDCDRNAKARGWCMMHYHRWWRNNAVDPGEFGEPAPKKRDTRPTVSYHHVHVRLRAERGRASDRLCEDGCGRQAKHWAYDHGDPDELTSPEGWPYSTDPSHYWALCPSCHKLHDIRAA